MTTQKLYETVLDQFGFKPVQGMEITRMIRHLTNTIHYADIQEKDGKTTIQLFGTSGDRAESTEYDTGKLRLSETQLGQLLTIIVTNHD